jgi:alkanesulfonate monooxygenase SsuD/methylene tetrahydromethanopterin reductase-like flavin-dependent oxidoreductase (luciferase family)
MESRYKIPFGKFASWCPVGSAKEIAEYIRAYADAGCQTTTLVMNTRNPEEAVEQAGEIRAEVASG